VKIDEVIFTTASLWPVSEFARKNERTKFRAGLSRARSSRLVCSDDRERQRHEIRALALEMKSLRQRDVIDKATYDRLRGLLRECASALRAEATA
jgi:hypothetical protein